MDGEFSVQDEVDESVYDRYLYHTGQSNRIIVNSVMMGSAAEDSGIKGGDQIVRYEDQRMYNFNDLRLATTQGARDELVDLTVVRNGNEVTMSIPPVEVSWFAARCDDVYGFLGVPDPKLRSSFARCSEIARCAGAGSSRERTFSF